MLNLFNLFYNIFAQLKIFTTFVPLIMFNIFIFYL
jgi:hypothetical protein